MKKRGEFRPKTTDEIIHESVVDTLVNRLQHSGRYKTLEKHLLYSACGLNGEADVIGTTNNGSVHYYEIKCRYHPNNYARAQAQFHKFSQVYPEFDLRFIYVTPTVVKRVYNP